MTSDDNSAKNLDSHPNQTNQPNSDEQPLLDLDARPLGGAPKTAMDDPFSYMPDRMGNHMNSPSNSETSSLVPDARIGAGESQQQAPSLPTQQEDNLIKYNHLTYLLYTLSFFTAGLIWIVPIVMNYLRRREADNTWLATHFDWQIKTFWYSLVLGGVGAAIIMFSLSGLGISIIAGSGNIAIGSVLLIGLGAMLLFVAVLWHFYRIVRGWIALADKRPIP